MYWKVAQVLVTFNAKPCEVIQRLMCTPMAAIFAPSTPYAGHSLNAPAISRNLRECRCHLLDRSYVGHNVGDSIRVKSMIG